MKTMNARQNINEPSPASELFGFWQPIATAPKNRSILLHSGGHGVVIASWCIFSGRRNSNGEREGGWSFVHDFGDGYGTPALNDATHWMPLPSKPNEKLTHSPS